jgi:hypothetical protein
MSTLLDDPLAPAATAAWGPGRFFRDAQGGVNSLDFHRTEDLLVASCAVPQREPTQRRRSRAYSSRS